MLPQIEDLSDLPPARPYEVETEVDDVETTEVVSLVFPIRSMLIHMCCVPSFFGVSSPSCTKAYQFVHVQILTD